MYAFIAIVSTYNQTGSHFHSKHKPMKGMKSLAAARLTIESRETNPQVQHKIQRDENEYKTGKRKSKLSNGQGRGGREGRLVRLIAKDRTEGLAE